LLFGRGDNPTGLALGEAVSTSQKSSNYMVSFTGNGDEIVVRDLSQSGNVTESRGEEGGDNEETNNDEETETTMKEVSLNLVLTNAVILQEFATELAAIIHVRGSFVKWEVQFT